MHGNGKHGENSDYTSEVELESYESLSELDVVLHAAPSNHGPPWRHFLTREIAEAINRAARGTRNQRESLPQFLAGAEKGQQRAAAT